MSMITVQHLTFSYDGSYDNIFEDVSFTLDTDWKLGFIGRNGRGKTTFLRLLLGEFEYRGTISASVPFSYFPPTITDEQAFTRDIAHALSPDALDWEIVRELSLLEVDDEVLDRPFSTLSPGERTKVLLAALFTGSERFLLIDEPTNHLDTHAREVVADYLNSKRGFILVSHDRRVLDSCVDHILSINRSDIEVMKGNYTTWREMRDRQDQFERVENEKLERDIGRLQSAARRTGKWADDVEKTRYNTFNAGLKLDRGYVGHKSAKMMKRAKVTERRMERAAEDKKALLKNVEEAETLKLAPLTHYADPLIELVDMGIAYGPKIVCEDVTFSVRRGDRIALTGKNGSGKSSILKAIAGEVPHTGTLRLASGLVLSVLPQDASFLCGDMRAFIAQHDLDETLFKSILRKLDFERVQFEKPLDALSAGQKKKVLLAKSLCESAHIYLWDEPLNYIDLLSREQIESLILTHAPTMLFVEHDRAFVDAIATSRVEL